GEGLIDPTELLTQFLSRLCGGEGLIDPTELLTQFLSRLCGGEVTTAVADLTKG
ncbi:hypothetical protein HG532_11640, partial [Moraxella osloensis]|nr:hypothetical protein [Moraxella osloensis]